jgi:hypothetical protein
MRETRSRIEKINPAVIEGGVILISEFMKGTFVAGLRDDRIKYIFKARGDEESLAQLVETALQEESEVKSQKFKGNTGNLTLPNSGCTGYMKKDFRPQIKREVNIVNPVKCFKCQRAGHKANDCRVRPTCERCHKVGHEARNCRIRGPQGNGQ